MRSWVMQIATTSVLIDLRGTGEMAGPMVCALEQGSRAMTSSSDGAAGTTRKETTRWALKDNRRFGLGKLAHTKPLWQGIL